MSRFQFKRRQFSSLEALEVQGSEEGPTVVLFHGFGADMGDLAPLAEVLGAPEGTNWIFPNGHLTVPLGGHYEGRAWFPISIADLEKTMGGSPLDWSERIPPGMNDARERAMDLLNELDVSSERLILGGFSQGAMLATEVTLNLEKPPAGLAIISGTLINAKDWKSKAEKLKGFPFFQSHGAQDPVLSFEMAARLEKLWLEAGWSGQLMKFNGGHEIPQSVLSQLGGYIRRRLKQNG